MSEVSSRASLKINFSGGSFTLKRCKSGKATFESDLENVQAVGVFDGAAGFREKVGGGELTLDIYAEAGKPEVDYFRMWATRETFGFTLKFEDGGYRFMFRVCRVASPPEIGVDEANNNMLTVKIKFQKFVANAPTV